MAQDRESGAVAAKFGLQMGRILAQLLDAKLVRRGSNEVVWNGSPSVIKSCKLANTSFGITVSMLERLEFALVAIEDTSGNFDIYELPIQRFKSQMRDSKSGAADGRVKLLPSREAELHGRAIARFSAEEIRVVERGLV